jgi:hypothetical protein
MQLNEVAYSTTEINQKHRIMSKDKTSLETQKQPSCLGAVSGSNLSVTDLITDLAVEIAFHNTNFGSRSPREMIAKDLDQIHKGFHVGHTIKCCLIELGLIYESKDNLWVSAIGKKYLQILAIC